MKANITHNELKFYSSLLQKKFRKQHNLFLAEGSKLVKDALASKYKITKLLATEIFFSKKESFLNSNNAQSIETLIVKEKDFHKLSDTKTPQGIAAVCKIEQQTNVRTESDLIIALENISDPGNVGTIFRNCDWFGFYNIILSKNCAEVFSPKVLRSSMGSVFHTNIFTTDSFINEIENLKGDGFQIITADLKGKILFDVSLNQKTVIVFCNEANGPSEEIKKITEFSITIPKYGQAESLNVASASAVILSHFAKQ
jgi:TrmH family RNA methyltransferase